MNGANVGTGLFIVPDTNMVFAAFLSLQGSRSSKEVIEADGLLTYDKETNNTKFSNKEKTFRNELTRKLREFEYRTIA